MVNIHTLWVICAHCESFRYSPKLCESCVAHAHFSVYFFSLVLRMNVRPEGRWFISVNVCVCTVSLRAWLCVFVEKVPWLHLANFDMSTWLWFDSWYIACELDSMATYQLAYSSISVRAATPLDLKKLYLWIGQLRSSPFCNESNMFSGDFPFSLLPRICHLHHGKHPIKNMLDAANSLDFTGLH